MVLHFGYRPGHVTATCTGLDQGVLGQIAAFREVLPKQKSLEDVTAWWDRCIEIDASIETDRRASSYEKSRVQNLRTAVTDAIIRVRDYGYEPDTSRISVALTALQHSLVRRTIRP
jgi:hypothetical protein